MDDAMRERATSQEAFESLQRVVVGAIKATVLAHGTCAESSWVSSASKRIAKDVQHNFLIAFATSEADRRERECIEALCVRCAHGDTPFRDTPNPHFTSIRPAWKHGEWLWCEAMKLHELRYQREQGGK